MGDSLSYLDNLLVQISHLNSKTGLDFNFSS